MMAVEQALLPEVTPHLSLPLRAVSLHLEPVVEMILTMSKVKSFFKSLGQWIFWFFDGLF